MTLNKATKEDYLTYSHKKEEELPEEFDFMLDRANDEILMLVTSSSTLSFAQSYYTKAVCAQVDFYIQNGIEVSSEQQISSISIGQLSKTYTSNYNPKTHLSSLSVRYLDMAGLTYKGATI